MNSTGFVKKIGIKREGPLPSLLISAMGGGEGRNLLDFAFFIDDMLADYGIKLFDLHLFRHVFLVLGGGVEMPRSGT
jgi:hypothetical protein